MQPVLEGKEWHRACSGWDPVVDIIKYNTVERSKSGQNISYNKIIKRMCKLQARFQWMVLTLLLSFIIHSSLLCPQDH